MFDKHDGGYGAGLLIVIVLVVLFAAFARGGWGGWGGGDGHGHGGGYTMPYPYPYPAYAGAWGRGCGCEGIADATTVANYENRDIAYVKQQIAADTGKIIHTMDVQNCGIKGEIAAEARRADDRFYSNELSNARLKIAELEAKNLHEKTVGAIAASNCELNHRLDKIECEMLKRPPVWPHVGVPAIQDCGRHHEPHREIIREVRTAPEVVIQKEPPRVYVERRPEFFDGRRDGFDGGCGPRPFDFPYAA